MAAERLVRITAEAHAVATRIANERGMSLAEVVSAFIIEGAEHLAPPPAPSPLRRP